MEDFYMWNQFIWNYFSWNLNYFLIYIIKSSFTFINDLKILEKVKINIKFKKTRIIQWLPRSEYKSWNNIFSFWYFHWFFSRLITFCVIFQRNPLSVGCYSQWNQWVLLIHRRDLPCLGTSNRLRSRSTLVV